MIPIRDEIRSRTTPYVNYTLVGLNIVVFVGMNLLGARGFESAIESLALVPLWVTRGPSVDDLLHMLTSMFVHGSLAHLAGNLLYLWIFGDNVEDAMGHLRYLVFYLLGGFLAAVAHIFSNPYSVVPTVGASGAIAAVLGAYLVLYPGSRVQTLVPFGFFIRITVLPAFLVLGFWFMYQLLLGFASLGLPADVGGVAFWAHIGGFVAGMLLAKMFAVSRDYYGGSNY
jgi:membrane associated rhomboid family serine protease